MKINTRLIKLALAEQRMTQLVLAERSGISRQSISTILTRGTCSAVSAGRLAEGLGIKVEDITTED